MAIVTILGVGALLATLWAEHRVPVILPSPTGPFAVGRVTSAWAGDTHELLVWIWYPAASRQPSQTIADYLPAPWRSALDLQTGVLFSHFFTRDLSRVRTHSIRDAEMSPQQRLYPVVIMRAGLAALTTDYTTLAEDLASHGYVVVGLMRHIEP